MSRLGLVVMGAAGLLLLGACGWTVGKNQVTEETPIGQTITAVRVANDSGEVRIHAGDRTLVRRTVHYDRERPGNAHRVDGAVLLIDGCPVRACWIDYDITVPTGTTVQGAMESGDVEIDGVGKVDLRSSSGEVTIRHVSGPVNVDASSGNVTVDGATADVKVRAESGEVTVTLASAHNVTARAESGNVEVAVPRAGYQVTADTDSGQVRNDITADADAGNRLDLRTESGDITVRYA